MREGSPFTSALEEALKQHPWNTLNPSPQQKGMLAFILEELSRWNKTFSFTSITHPRDMVEVFILDSLAPLALGMEIPSPLLDAGCGVGFPSLPLKILSPRLQVTAVDSSRKKINFLRHVVRNLKIKGYTPRWERLETLVEEGVTFPSITVRALTGGERVYNLVASLLSQGGRALLYVGSSWTSSQLPSGLELQDHLTYTLPFSGKVRGLVLATRVV